MNIPENFFIFINLFILILYLAFIFIGYKKGLLYELVNLLYTAVSLLIAWIASPVLASLFPIIDVSSISDGQYQTINSVFNLNSIINNILYFLIIFLVLKLLYIFISLILKSLNKLPVIGEFNQILGAVFGFFNATVIVLALSMLLSLPLFKNGNEIKEKTVLKYITAYSDAALEFVIDKIGQNNYKNDLSGFDIESYREDLKQWILKHQND